MLRLDTQIIVSGAYPAPARARPCFCTVTLAAAFALRAAFALSEANLSPPPAERKKNLCEMKVNLCESGIFGWPCLKIQFKILY
jgi:hypothetical protein